MSDGSAPHSTHIARAGDDDSPLGQLNLAPGVTVDAGLVSFAFSRSAGPGGQNVNKRSTKAELRVLPGAIPLPHGSATRLLTVARGYLTTDGEILIVSDEHRSQGQNKEACLARLRALIIQAQHVPKRRVKTKPSRGSVERRIAAKKSTGEKKRRRRDTDE